MRFGLVCIQSAGEVLLVTHTYIETTAQRLPAILGTARDARLPISRHSVAMVRVSASGRASLSRRHTLAV